jgi:hypothetical protein
MRQGGTGFAAILKDRNATIALTPSASHGRPVATIKVTAISAELRSALASPPLS